MPDLSLPFDRSSSRSRRNRKFSKGGLVETKSLIDGDNATLIPGPLETFNRPGYRLLVVVKSYGTELEAQMRHVAVVPEGVTEHPERDFAGCGTKGEDERVVGSVRATDYVPGTEKVYREGFHVGDFEAGPDERLDEKKKAVSMHASFAEENEAHLGFTRSKYQNKRHRCKKARASSRDQDQIELT